MMEDVCKIMPKTVTFYGVHSISRTYADVKVEYIQNF